MAEPEGVLLDDKAAELPEQPLEIAGNSDKLVGFDASCPPDASTNPPIATWKLKVLYFMIFGKFVPGGRFFTIYFDSLGLSSLQIGALTGIMPITRVLSLPPWTVIADMSNNPKKVWTIALLAGTLAFMTFMLAYIPGWKLYVVYIATILYSAAQATECPLLDSITVHAVGPVMYGQQRMWGAVSWGLLNPIIGVLTDYAGVSVIFPCFLAFAIFLLISIRLFLPNKFEEPRSRDHETERLRFRDYTNLVFGSPQAFALFSTAMTLGMGISVVENLLFVFLIHDLGASRTLCAISVTVTVLIEIPIFYYAEFLLARLGSSGLILIAQACYISRVVGYTYLHNPWHVLFLEPLHGITFGCFHTAAIHRLASIAPKHMKATAQGVYMIFFDGLGVGAGAMIGGAFMQRYGARAMYRGAAVAVSISAILFILTNFSDWIGERCCNKRARGGTAVRRSSVQYEQVLDETSIN